MTIDELTAWREARGLSKNDAAAALGIARNTLLAYETRGGDVPRLVELAVAGYESTNPIRLGRVDA